MLIILEGPDLAGKTTLAERLITYLSAKFPRDRVQLIHRGPPSRHPLDEYAVPLLDYQPGQGLHLVIDRWHWGELVYPPIMNRPTKMTRWLFNYIEMLVIQRGGFTVHITADDRELLRRFDARGDDMQRREDLPLIANTFRRIALETGYSGWTYEAHSPDYIVDRARDRELRALTHSQFVTPVSMATYPRVLLVGDRRNCQGAHCDHRTRHLTTGTAFMPYPATSGDFLLRALDATFFDFGQLALANAADVDAPRKIWREYNYPRVVALGRKAHLALESVDVPHAVAPHPQFVRRFHHAAIAEYGRLIQELVGTERNELAWRPHSQPKTDAASTLVSSNMS